MAKRKVYKEGQVYGIEFFDKTWTIAQLIFNFRLENSTYQQNTFAFFNYRDTWENLKNDIKTFDLTNPIAIASTNSNPRTYGWKLICKKDIIINLEYKSDISSSSGLYKNCSTDPAIFLEPYFGLFPWDGYYKDNYLDNKFLPNAEMRDDIKYIKDYNTKELIELLGENSIKVKQRLEEKNSKNSR